jgi:hypothetical protein
MSNVEVQIPRKNGMMEHWNKQRNPVFSHMIPSFHYSIIPGLSFGIWI